MQEKSFMSAFESHSGRKLRIVIPGGSGQVGHVLARHFHEQGHSVTVLSRRPESAPWQTLTWNGGDLGDWTRPLMALM
jgi:hypothetical protein